MVDPTAAVRGRTRRAVDATTVTASMLALFAGVTIVTPLLPQYQATWHLTSSAVTGIFVGYLPGVVLALLGLGRLADAVGGELVILIALTLGDLAALLALLAPTAGCLVAARALHGLGVGLVPGATAAALAGAGVSSRRTALALSIATTTGIAAGLVVGGLLADAGATSAWLGYLLVLVLATLKAAADVLGRTGPARRQRRLVQRPAVPRRGLRAPFALALCGAAVSFAAVALFAGLGPLLIGRPHGGSPLAGSLVAAAAYLVSGLTQLSLARRLPARTGAVVLAVGLVALDVGVGTGRLLPLLGAAVLIGIGNGLLFPATLAATARLAAGTDRAGVTSTYYLAMYAGIALPLLGVGVLADATSLPAAIRLVATAVGAAALLLAVLDPARPGSDVVTTEDSNLERNQT